MKNFKRLLLTVCSLLLLVSQLLAQDDGIKDELTVIKIYMRINYRDSACFSCDEQLKKKLEAIEGAWDVTVLPIKKIAVFYMYSNKIISERKLKQLIKQAGFIPVKVDYSKEEPEKEEDDQQAL